MNLIELKAKLVKEEFEPSTYSLDGSEPGYEGFILDCWNGMWKIEYCERGVRDAQGWFASEDEACDRMYELMQKYFR